MTHYVCTGTCHGVADTQKKCETQGCTREGSELKECHCEDGKHQEALVENADQPQAN